MLDSLAKGYVFFNSRLKISNNVISYFPLPPPSSEWNLLSPYLAPPEMSFLAEDTLLIKSFYEFIKEAYPILHQDIKHWTFNQHHLAEQAFLAQNIDDLRSQVSL